MAKAVGISPDSVHRIWRANDMKPHRVETFKLSSDPRFEEKFWDVIGLYFHPPERSLVLSVTRRVSEPWNAPNSRGESYLWPNPARHSTGKHPNSFATTARTSREGTGGGVPATSRGFVLAQPSMTQDVLRDGSFTSVGELASDIESS